MEAIFDMMDVNGDGQITRLELLTVLQSAGIPRDKVTTLFRAMDIDRDGYVDLKEFLPWLFGAGSEGSALVTKIIAADSGAISAGAHSGDMPGNGMGNMPGNGMGNADAWSNMPGNEMGNTPGNEMGNADMWSNMPGNGMGNEVPTLPEKNIKFKIQTEHRKHGHTSIQVISGLCVDANRDTVNALKKAFVDWCKDHGKKLASGALLTTDDFELKATRTVRKEYPAVGGGTTFGVHKEHTVFKAEEKLRDIDLDSLIDKRYAEKWGDWDPRLFVEWCKGVSADDFIWF
eukprot:TRINITY_DN26120_c0_g1_i1.p1 TRINITY_DN26120_c0_g1~~TRINITY_DN26120_c0_g1_i1.p1  ORF type:complete len:288 (-),score=54.73 TRINITY_DN26120_c0_g1_i1:212-1075(-)